MSEIEAESLGKKLELLRLERKKFLQRLLE